MSKMIVVSCDTETTSLNHFNGHAWAVGLYAVLIDKENNTWHEVLTEEYIIPVHPSLWDKATLQWARENCGNRLLNMLAKTVSNLVPQSTLHTAQRSTRDTFIPYINAINFRREEVDNILWVFNHPDFDVPFIEQILPSFKDRVGYRNIKDMQSLIEGHLGFAAAKEFMDENKPEAGIAHTALADAIAQWELLWKSGAIK